MVRMLGRIALAVFLVIAGTGHFVATETFEAQVPPVVPATEVVVWASGVVEIALGLALLVTARHRIRVGWLVAGLFVMVFPGNVSQYLTGTDAFGLETDAARATRLAFQPVLIAWALWCSGAWRAWRDPTTDTLGRPR